jgi:hypothetical protein
MLTVLNVLVRYIHSAQNVLSEAVWMHCIQLLQTRLVLITSETQPGVLLVRRINIVTERPQRIRYVNHAPSHVRYATMRTMEPAMLV